MADGEWLTPRQLSALSYEEQQAYIRQALEGSQEETSDHDSIDGDEPLGDIDCDDSDVEDPALPEYDPEDDSDSEEELEDVQNETGEYFTARDGNVWTAIQYCKKCTIWTSTGNTRFEYCRNVQTYNVRRNMRHNYS